MISFAPLSRRRNMLLRAHRSNDFRAAPPGDLHRRRPDSAIGADHQHPILRAHIRRRHQRRPRRHVRQTDRSRRIHRQVLRLGHQCRHRHAQILCVRSIPRESDIPTRPPHLAPHPIFGTAGDNSRKIPAGYPRQRRAVHLPLDILHIARINPRRPHLHQRLPIPHARLGRFLRLEQLRIAKLMDQNRAHDSFQHNLRDAKPSYPVFYRLIHFPGKAKPAMCRHLP